MALGRLFTVAANFTDPHAYFVGGGVVEAAPEFRDWFLATVREHTVLREEQAAVATLRAGAGPGHGRRPRRGHRRAGGAARGVSRGPPAGCRLSRQSSLRRFRYATRSS